jgi:hypothetical protein
VAVASELTTHGAAQGGVVCEEAGVVDPPHIFLLVGELDVGECCVLFVGAVPRGAGEEGTPSPLWTCARIDRFVEWVCRLRGHLRGNGSLSMRGKKMCN